jgi:hypothetical protein
MASNLKVMRRSRRRRSQDFRIISRLVHYAGSGGHNAFMRQVATALSLQERKAVADYLSHLPSNRPVHWWTRVENLRTCAAQADASPTRLTGTQPRDNSSL